jgi:hypothetical protein
MSEQFYRATFCKQICQIKHGGETVHEVIHKSTTRFCMKSAEKSFKTRIYVAVKVTDFTRFSLPYCASWRSVGLSSAGQTYVCEGEGRGVLALQVSGTGGQCTQLWRSDRPSDISNGPRIAATPGLCLMQDNRPGAPTVAVDGNGEVSRTQRQGSLIGCVASNRAVYVRDREDGGRGHEIVISSGADCVTLRPPADQQWSTGLSVCGNDARLAVVDGYRSPSTLDIFLEQQRK